MYTMDQVHRIRGLYFGQGKNLTEISEIMGCDWRTVRKYVDKADFSPKAPKAEQSKQQSKLSPYCSEIDTWLEEDRKAPRKQRHTAKRIYDRLKEAHSEFNASYRLMAEYVSEKKKQLNLTVALSFLGER